MIYLRFISLIISFTGMFYLIYNLLKPKKHFIPLITFSIIICVLFLFGIINKLFFGFICLFLIGIISFIYYFIIKYKELNLEILKLIIIFITIMIILTILLQNVGFVHYDDFFNWGNSAKLIFEYDTLLSKDLSISKECINYTPGISLLVYYVSKIIGFSEANCIIVKNFFTIATIIPFFIWTKKENKFTFLLPFVISIISIFGILIYDYKTMLIDIIQVNFAVSIFIYLSNKQIEKKDIITLTILCIAIYIIKETSIIYIFFNMLFHILLNKKNRKNKNIPITYFIIILSILLVTIGWKLYFTNYFTDVTKFNLKFEQWAKTLANKVIAEKTIKNDIYIYIHNFTSNYINTILNFNFISFRFLILVEIILLILGLKKIIDKKFSLKLVMTLLLIYVIYSIFYFIVYLFMMNYYETKILSAIERYFGQLLVYFIGIIFVIERINNNDKTYKIYLILLIIFEISILPNIFNNNDYKLYFKGDLNKEYIQKFKNIEGIDKIGKNENILLFYDSKKDPYYYSKVLAKYYFESNNIETVSKKDDWKSFYIVVLNAQNNFMYSKNDMIELLPYSVYKYENECANIIK